MPDRARPAAFDGVPGSDRPAPSPQPGADTRIAETSFLIEGMHCAACATSIEQALMGVAGVIEAHVSAASRCASVRYECARVQPSEMVKAVAGAGYAAVPDTAAASRALRRREARVALWRWFVAGLCAMQVMMLATPSYIAGPGELTSDLKRLLDWGSWLLTLPVMVFSAAPFFAGAWRSVSHARIGMDVPVALGIAVAFIASSGAAFDPGGVFGREVYFDSLTMFVAFLLGGRYLEMRARHRASMALEAALGSLPETVVRVKADGGIETVRAEKLCRGDTVRVPVGEAFAADGRLTQGATHADESLVSGESMPVAKEVGDAVIAGSTNLHAPVLMRVERVGPDTRYEAIIALMREARTQRPAFMSSSERWAVPFLWTVLLLAAGAAAVWSVLDPTRAIGVAVSVLIVTCPCALSLAAPSALLAAANAMARRGLLLRKLEAIEGLARMQTLFVDKTGTLTEAMKHSVRVEIEPPLLGEDMLRIASSLGAWSTHPIAAMLATSADAATIAWRDVMEVAGCGMEATHEDGSLWRLGAPQWAGSATPQGDPHSDAAACLSRNGHCVARFHFEDRPRADAAEAVRALRSDGVSVVLISGDAARRVEALGSALDLDRSLGGLSPEAKLAAVTAEQRNGRFVAMLGDGINDAPVLAQADVSFAMGEGALVARAQADGVLISNKLGDLMQARVLAQKTLRVVRQNLVWAAAYNATCIPLAVAGWFPPWAAGLGMATSSLAVVLNSMRLAR